MMETKKIYDELCNKRPLVYQVGENYYVLGYFVCRKCTPEEIDLFEKLKSTYLMETRDISLSCLEKTDVKNTVHLFEELLKRCDKQNKKNNNDLNSFLYELSKLEIVQINEQTKWYKELYDFEDGAFYRFDQ